LYALQRGARSVVMTDYPSPEILAPLQGNLRANWTHGNAAVAGYAWGDDPSPLFELPEKGSGSFDVLVLSDLLWYTASHGAILESVVGLLASDGIAWIACGRYTTMDAVSAFLRAAELRGLYATRVELSSAWEGKEECELENLNERKGTVWVWKMVWTQS